MPRRETNPTAYPKRQPFEYRTMRGDPGKVQVKICDRWFTLTRGVFNRYFDRATKRPTGQGERGV